MQDPNSELNSEMTYEERFNKFYEIAKASIEDEGMAEAIYVTKQGEEVLFRVFDSALFDSGKAEITNEAEEVLDSISKLLTKHKDSIKFARIEGHTDNVPMKKTGCLRVTGSYHRHEPLTF